MTVGSVCRRASVPQEERNASTLYRFRYNATRGTLIKRYQRRRRRRSSTSGNRHSLRRRRSGNRALFDNSFQHVHLHRRRHSRSRRHVISNRNGSVTVDRCRTIRQLIRQIRRNTRSRRTPSTVTRRSRSTVNPQLRDILRTRNRHFKTP